MATSAVPLPTRRQGHEWPDGHLDVQTLKASGWRPVPIRQFLLKAYTRCNLNCDYCYVYEHADQSWQSKPVLMSSEVVAATADRIGEHVEAHGLDEVRIIIHGGEPLLAGRSFLENVVKSVSAAVPDGCRASFGMQTNGVLVTDAVIDLCVELNVSLGISLDGDREANDRHRVHRNGRSSYDEVVLAIERLRSSPNAEIFTGILCTIDLANDPIRTYDHLVSLGPPAVDFLLPHGNWSERPPGWIDGSTPYADWLVAIFDRWFEASRRQVRIRFFEEIINLLLGGHSQVETVGLTPTTLAVVETNGMIEQVDSLKSAFDGAPDTGLSVFDSSFDTALSTPGMAARQIGADALCQTCSECSWGSICGGGYYPHRYRPATGFLNPSVYCDDLFRLISHIGTRLDSAMRNKATDDG